MMSLIARLVSEVDAAKTRARKVCSVVSHAVTVSWFCSVLTPTTKAALNAMRSPKKPYVRASLFLFSRLQMPTYLQTT